LSLDLSVKVTLISCLIQVQKQETESRLVRGAHYKGSTSWMGVLGRTSRWEYRTTSGKRREGSENRYPAIDGMYGYK
jgi:hypothetical protein